MVASFYFVACDKYVQSSVLSRTSKVREILFQVYSILYTRSHQIVLFWFDRIPSVCLLGIVGPSQFEVCHSMFSSESDSGPFLIMGQLMMSMLKSFFFIELKFFAFECCRRELKIKLVILPLHY